MKRNTYIYSALCLICLLICTFSCTDELGINYVNQTEVKGFALDEAKEFFQNEAGTQTTRSQYSENQKGIYPGDFIPKWETATGSSKNGLACYDIPINADNSFKAVYTEDKYGKLTAQKVNVYQKLVIVKDTKSERMSQYVLTLIPSKAYDNQYGRQVCNKFINCSDKGGFTGIAMYSTVYSNVTIRVNTYKDGIKTQGVSFLNISNAEDWTDKYALVNKILSSVSLQKNKIMTRGEDDFIWDGGYLDEVIITPPSNVGADGMTNEEWLESSRPNNGYVDPDPDPDPQQPETDYPTPDIPDNPDEKPIPFSETENQKVNKLLEELKNTKNIDPTKYSISKLTYCGNTARTDDNGNIQLCDLFFDSKFQDTDRIAIIWHEMYHVDHMHYGEYSTTQLNEPITLTPPADVEEWLKEKIVESYLGEHMPPGSLEILYQNEITVYNYISTDYYKNEIETHKAESESFPNVSNYYENERTYLEWYYNEMLNISNQQSKK